MQGGQAAAVRKAPGRCAGAAMAPMCQSFGCASARAVRAASVPLLGCAAGKPVTVVIAAALRQRRVRKGSGENRALTAQGSEQSDAFAHRR
jgi:hypothetical protein